ncbi:replication endonuclease, partial [Escherichia coli]|nr:replication endonuclease [Escherichia coli]
QRIYGICAPSLGERYTICTHPDEWKLVRKEAKADNSTDEDFDVGGGFAAPWTRGNNCPRDEKTNNETNKTPPPEGRKNQKLTIPEG